MDNKYFKIIKYSLLILLLPSMYSLICSEPTEEIKEIIRFRVEEFQDQNKSGVCGEFICAVASIPKFYVKRNFIPAWITDTGIKKEAQLLIDVLELAGDEGLVPGDYHLKKLKKLKIKLEEEFGKTGLVNQELVDFEILLTDSYLLYASHLHLGKVHPELIAPYWKAERRNDSLNFTEYLERALKSNDIVNSLKVLTPNQEEYKQLKKVLIELNNMRDNGGWGTISFGSNLKEGMEEPRVENLRKRLEMDNYLFPCKENRNYFDQNLKKAVLDYQYNNGLVVDGVVGINTISMMNISIDDRIEQIRVNMERWRWLPNDLGKRHIRVNIAHFDFEVYENDNLILHSKAIVGRTYRKTPVFSSTMTHIVFNPYWTIPHGILTNDIIPAVKRDANYLDHKQIKVLDNKNNIINPSTINWQTVNTWQYTFRQDPGVNNSLGLMKFMFPNSYNVYIHDTPAKSLFEKTTRTFSSGCIRIQKPYELAEYLLKNQDDWDRVKIESITSQGGNPLYVYLDSTIAVHILYHTVGFEEGKRIQFRKDIYERDNGITAALSSLPPKWWLSVLR